MQDDRHISRSLANRSQESWNDAHAPAGVLSERSRIDALFSSGYFALLALASRDARQALLDHPDVEFIRVACAAVGVPAAVGVRFAENQYAAFDEERPTLEQIHLWAEELRDKLSQVM